MSTAPRSVALVALTTGGRRLAAALAAALPGGVCEPVQDGVRATLTRLWTRYEGIVCVMAAGIVVRAVAPLLADKRQDPCVVVMDERGQWAVSLVGGHLGGGNELARSLARLTGGQAVITTASDVLGRTALDVWLAANGLTPEPPELVTWASGLLVNRGFLQVACDVPGPLPDDFQAVEVATAEVAVTWRAASALPPAGRRLLLRPPVLAVGVGCNRGTPVEEFDAALAELFAEAGLAIAAVRCLASIDLKRDEPGLRAFAARHQWPLVFFDKDRLNTVPVAASSPAVQQATGARGVAEPAACLAAGTGQLLVRKRKWQNVTLAVAKAAYTLSEPVPAIPTT